MLDNYATPEIAESWRRYYEQEDCRREKRRPPRIPIKILIVMELQEHKEGLTWKDLTNSFSKSSLDRHLRALIKEGLVEKNEESQCRRCKGRLPTRYRTDAQIYWVYPSKQLGSAVFFGTWACRKSNQEGHAYIVDRKSVEVNRSSIRNLKGLVIKKIIKKPKPRRFVRLFPAEKKKLEEHKAWLKFKKRWDWFRENYPQEFEQLLALERDKAKQRIKPDLDVMKDLESFLKDRGIEIRF